MPQIHERVFRVRHYECDAYGHLNHTNYLRYMQEAALEAPVVAADAVSGNGHAARSWAVREADITYLRPLTYGDAITVKSWLDGAHDAQARRAYEMRRADSGYLAAVGHLDWAWLEQDTHRPLARPEVATTADPFPEPPPPPSGVYVTRRRVEWRDVDPAQQVDQATYLTYMEECGLSVCRARGWTTQRMFAAGFGILARRYRIQYCRPAQLGDELEVATWASNVKRATAVRHFTVTRVSDGALLARARSLWVWVDLQNGRPIRIPPDFYNDFIDHVSCP